MMHEDEVLAAVFSPDGRWLATGSGDGTARLWDVSTLLDTGVADPAAEPVVLRGHENPVVGVAFSPDGRWVATGSWDGTARLWDVSTLLGTGVADPTTEPAVLRGHEDMVSAVAFSPDGRWLATGSYDHTAQVWDAATGAEVARMEHEDPVVGVAFSPDGRWVATGSEDGTARVWWWQPGDLIAEACARLPRNLTREEWQQYLGNEPYCPTCPNLPVPEE